MATQKKATTTKKGIKVRDLKPSKDAKGGFEMNKHLSAQGSRGENRAIMGATKGLN